MKLSVSDLSKDQARAALEVTDNILTCVCGCDIAKAGEGKVLPFENAMVELLLVEWGNATKKSVKEAQKRLTNGYGPIKTREMNNILTIIEQGIVTRFVEGSNNGLPKIINGAYVKGKKDVFKKFKQKVKFAEIDDKAKDWLFDHHMYWIENYYDKHVSKKISDVVTESLKEGLGRKDTGKKLKEFFDDYPGVPNKPEVYWRGTAANAMNRTRNFGLIQGYEELGIKELRVSAIIDERTSSICLRLNGKIIPVSRAVGQRDLLMAADDPEDVKTITPWVSVDEIKGLSTKSIMDKGVIMPPYHFHCRTTVVENI